jgi:hypothetical protein
MRSIAALYFAGLFFSLSVHAAAAPLEPAGKWTVDFGESRCVAYRTFGPSKSPVYLLLKPSPVGDVLQLQIAEKGIKRPGVQESVRLALGNSPPFPMLQLQYGVDGKQVRMVNLSKEQTASLSAATSLHWMERGKQYQLALGPMTKLLETVEKCRAQLSDYWNGTLTKYMSLQKPPTLNKPLQSLFSTDDYPWDAVRQRQSGLAHVVVLVDEKGGIVDCTLIATSGIAVLDAQTCIIIRKRGKFAPAVGADGKPTKGIFHQRVNWVMP